MSDDFDDASDEYDYGSSCAASEASVSEASYSALDEVETSRKKALYGILTEDGLRERQTEAVEQVSALLGIPEDDAEHLLRQFKWDTNRLSEEWWNNTHAVRTKAGLHEPQSEPSTSKARGPKVKCNICFEDYRTSAMCCAPCKHYFCKDCWRGYVQEAITNGPTSLNLSCPLPDCKAHVPSSVIHEVSSLEDQEKYKRFRLRSFVEDNDVLEWCPAPDCSYAAESLLDLQGEAVDVTCKCGTAFCFNCKEEAHRPVDCETVKKWLIKNSAESENLNWILANTKACPKCKRPIEKNQGCMHMTCSQCSYQFCWLCLASWVDHGDRTGGYYACNRYESAKQKGEYDEEAQRREHAKHALERYMHYYHRWAENDKAKKAAAKKMQTTQRQILEALSNFYATPASQLKFVLDAWYQVVDCRRILKWTYAFGFYNFDESIKSEFSKPVLKQQQEFFEFNQAEAESCLERLHGVSEKELEALANEETKVDMEEWAKFRERLIGLTDVTKSHFEKLVKELEKGMEQMLNGYDGAVGSSQAALEAEVQQAAEAKKKAQPKPAAKATGKRTRASQRRQSGLEVEAGAFTDFWQCNTCTFANQDLDAQVCEICNAARGAGV